MSDSSAAHSYQMNAARGASPVGQVVALYDTILRDLRRALNAADAGDVETRVFELNHALTVIAHLRSVLDHARGGEAAKRFQRFYDITRAMILTANVSGSRSELQKLIDLYTGMRQAWEHADRQLRPADSACAPAAEQGTSSARDEQTSAGNWNA
ncbi:MAG TPA: flagellar export chaperone FliS [Dongiaceae bacterium]|nr:flagellar export chaperone FliS [Dongiaceae bacterium]